MKQVTGLLNKISEHIQDLEAKIKTLEALNESLRYKNRTNLWEYTRLYNRIHDLPFGGHIFNYLTNKE